MRKSVLGLSVLLFASCGDKTGGYDASGVFEATEIIVSAEQTGRLMLFDLSEGDKIQSNVQLGMIDTMQLYLQFCQIDASRKALIAQLPEKDKQIATLDEQLKKAEEEVARFEPLVAEGAANSKALDDAKSQASVIRAQKEALWSSLDNSTLSLSAQIESAASQMKQVSYQIGKCRISSPIQGVVLEKYAQEGEFATVGKPLFKVADTDNLILRAYITAHQYNSVRLDQNVRVYVDRGESDCAEYEGKVCWISQKAEFTPKTIQTRDERANLVYPIKIAVRNDGLIKIGMYGDVKF